MELLQQDSTKRWMAPIDLPPTPPSELLEGDAFGTSPIEGVKRHRAPFQSAQTPGTEIGGTNGPLHAQTTPGPLHRPAGSVGNAGFGRNRPPFAYKSSADVYDVKETHTSPGESYRHYPHSRRPEDYANNTFSGLLSSAFSSASAALPIHAAVGDDRKLSISSPREVLAQLPNLFTPRATSPLPTAATGPHVPPSILSIPSTETIRFVALCALWYFSSAMSSNTGKAVMNRFRYPVTLTLIQFGYVASYCVLFCFMRERWSTERRARNAAYGQKPGWGITPATQQAMRGTLIMSVFQIAGHVFSSMAIARVPVSTVHTIKALSPLFTVASYVFLFGVRYSSKTYLSLLPLTLGVMMACSFEFRGNAGGFLCALGSTIVFVSQNIFSKKLLPRDSRLDLSETPGRPTSKLDKLNLLLYSSGMAFILMIPIWLYTDGSRLLGVRMPPSDPKPSISYLLFLFTVNGTVHFGQNLLAFTILSCCSPVTYSVASLCKRIAVICIAIVSFGQSIHGIQLLGMVLTFFGLWLYNQAKHDVAKGERKRGVAERSNTSVLPTSMGSTPAAHFAPGSPFAHPPANLMAAQEISPTQVLRE